MNRWVISTVLSGWSAGASVFINTFLAFQLTVVEYGVWVKLTALLPLVSALMAPMVLMCSRVNSEYSIQARVAERILVMSSTVASILALCLVSIDLMFQFGTLYAFALWVVTVCKVSLDGLLCSPNIIRLGMADKIARSVFPTIVLLALLVFRPTSAKLACLCIAAATGFCALGTMRWFSRQLNRERVSLTASVRLYLQELPSTYLSLVSLGVYSIPLFIFSTKNDQSAAALLGVTLTVVQGSASFANIILSQHMLSVATALTPNKHPCVMRISAPLGVIIMCCFFAPVLIGGYGYHRSISCWPTLAFATTCLVVVETSQGIMTNVLLRLGKRKVILSATVSAVLNIILVVALADPINLILSIACVQFLAFLLPGVWQISLLAKKRGSNLQLSF